MNLKTREVPTWTFFYAMMSLEVRVLLFSYKNVVASWWFLDSHQSNPSPLIKIIESKRKFSLFCCGFSLSCHEFSLFYRDVSLSCCEFSLFTRELSLFSRDYLYLSVTLIILPSWFCLSCCVFAYVAMILFFLPCFSYSYGPEYLW